MMTNLFIFIADSWGSIGGGINSFNYDLSIACAKIAKSRKDCKICCVIPALSDEIYKEIKDTDVLPITLHNSDFQSKNAFKLIIEHVRSELRRHRLFLEDCTVFWIGHDIYTGELAEQCATESRGWSIVFHHMDYASYYIYKNQNIEKYRQKVDRQKNILCAADLVCAVGPKLQASAQDIVRRENNLKVLEVFPGVADFKPIKIAPNRFSPLVFGRVEKENQKVKQISLAICAYAKAIANDKTLNIIGDDPRLTVIGYQDENTESLEREVARLNQNASEIAGKLCNVVPLPYIESRKELEEKITEASLVMMLSVHEGFGLVGYEAIAGGVPVILSKNTGLYQFLKKHCMDHYVYGVDIEGSCATEDGYSEKDLETVSTALTIIRKNEKEYKEKALELHDRLLSQDGKYSWNAVAHNFIDNVFHIFNTEIKRTTKMFYQLQELTPSVAPEHESEIVEKYLRAGHSGQVIKIEGNNAFGVLIENLKKTHLDKKDRVLIYNLISEPDNKRNAYDDFIMDCKEYFDSGNLDDSPTWFAENKLANKLQNTILILNHFPKDSSASFEMLFSVLKNSKKDITIFAVSDTNSPLKIHSTALETVQPILCEAQQLLVKILSLLKLPYTKKIIKYVCNAINLHLEMVCKKPLFINVSEDEYALFAAGFIEEYSKYSFQNSKQLYEMADRTEVDRSLYAVGVFSLGRYYARCYNINRNEDPQLRWAVFSCQCFDIAIDISADMKQEIKKEYETILCRMRIKLMRTAKHDLYIRLIEGFIEKFKEPDNLWTWYNLFHSQSIYQPKKETLEMVEWLLDTKIKKLDFEEPENTELYIQFIRLCAELENDLNVADVTDKLVKREKLVSTQKMSNVIRSQYISTLITVAIDQGEYDLAAKNIKKLKKMSHKNDPYPWINACALETTLEIVQFKKGIKKTLNKNLLDLKKAYKMAHNLIHDVRSQSWINGLWGEYLMLKGEQEGEKKVKDSLLNRRKSGEKTKGYRNWLSRIHSLELSSELQGLVWEEFVRTGIAEDEECHFLI